MLSACPSMPSWKKPSSSERLSRLAGPAVGRGGGPLLGDAAPRGAGVSAAFDLSTAVLMSANGSK
jgi:hypothetical protein